VGGADTSFVVEEVRESRYLDFHSSVSGTTEVVVPCT
jgi:hypothetical protein